MCKAGFESVCPHGGYFSACQAEYLRVPEADGTVVKVPGSPEDYDDATLASLLTISDVMSTGYHAAVSAEVKPGDTAVVMGDGAVGLCGVIAAKMRGATRIIAMSRHEDRAALAREFGATDIVPERGQAAIDKVLEMTGGYGADAVLECVGSKQSFDTAIGLIRRGAWGCRTMWRSAPKARSTPMSASKAARRRCATMTLTTACSTRYSRAKSTPAACSPASTTSTISRTPMRPWTSAR